MTWVGGWVGRTWVLHPVQHEDEGGVGGWVGGWVGGHPGPGDECEDSLFGLGVGGWVGRQWVETHSSTHPPTYLR